MMVSILSQYEVVLVCRQQTNICLKMIAAVL